MIWYPEEEFYLKTNLNKSEQIQVLDALIQENVSISDYYKKNGITKEYVGRLDSDRFKISRVLNDPRNSYNPIVQGKFLNKKVIQVKLRLHYYTQIFQLGFLGASFAIILIGLEENRQEFVYTGIGFILFSYLLMIGSFNFERKKIKRRIIEVLNAKEIDKNEC